MIKYECPECSRKTSKKKEFAVVICPACQISMNNIDGQTKLIKEGKECQKGKI